MADSWDDRQKEIRRLLDSIIQGSKDKGITNDELVALEDVAMKSFEVMETLNDTGQINAADPDDKGTLPLALVNLAVLMIRTAGISPLGALQLLMALFTLHTGIIVRIVTPDDIAAGDTEGKGMTEQTLRGALNRIMAKQKPAADQTVTPPPTDAQKAHTQAMVDELMASVWDTDSMKTH